MHTVSISLKSRRSREQPSRPAAVGYIRDKTSSMQLHPCRYSPSEEDLHSSGPTLTSIVSPTKALLCCAGAREALSTGFALLYVRCASSHCAAAREPLATGLKFRSSLSQYLTPATTLSHSCPRLSPSECPNARAFSFHQMGSIDSRLALKGKRGRPRKKCVLYCECSNDLPTCQRRTPRVSPHVHVSVRD